MSALAAFVLAAAAPLLLWHHPIEAMADDFRLNVGYIVTGWSGYILIASGLLLMLPVLVSVGLRPDSRLYPRSRNVFIGWGTSLYILGTASGQHRRLRRRLSRTGQLLDWRPMGRFRDPQDPLFQALNSSISFDFRLAPYDLEQSLAHARMLARSGIITDEDLAGIEKGLEAVRTEIDEDRVRDRAGRRGRAHGDRAPAHRDRRAGGREAAHRPVAQRPGGHRRGHARARSRPRGQGPGARADANPGGAGRAPPRLGAPRLHPPAAGPAGLPLASPAGPLLEAPPRSPALQLLPHLHGRPAARRGRAGRGELRHEQDVRGSGAGLRGNRRELAGRGVEPGLRAGLPLGRRHLLDPPVAARRGDRALVEPGVRLLRGGGRLQLGVEPHAAEEEPGRRGAAARQGAARGVPPRRRPRCAPRPAAHLQQGPPGGQGAALRRRGHARAVPAGGHRHARGHHLPPRAHGRGGVRRLHRRHRRGRRPGAPGRALPRGPRNRRRAWSAARWSGAGACPS